MTAPSNEKQVVKVALASGSVAGSEQILVNFSEDSSSFVGNRVARRPYELAASAVDSPIDLSGLVDTATWIMLIDKSAQITHVAMVAGVASGNRQQIAAGGILLYKNSNATPPTLYLSNPDAVNKCFGEILVLGASA